MPDQTIELLIKTKAELDGANAALAALEKQIGAQKALGKDTAAMEAQLQRGRQAVASYTGANEDLTTATSKLTEGLKTQAQHSEFLGQSHRRLHRLAEKLGEVWQPLGLVASAALNPVLVVLGSSIAIFAKAKEGLDEYNKTLDESATKAASGPLAAAMRARQEALHESAIKAGAFAIELERGITAEQRFQDLLANRLAILGEIATQQEAMAAAEVEREKARIKLLEATGQISPERALAMTGAVDRHAAVQSAAAATDRENREVAAKQLAMTGASTRAPVLKEGAMAARQIADEIAARLEFHKTALSTSYPEFEKIKPGFATPETEAKLAAVREKMTQAAAADARDYPGGAPGGDESKLQQYPVRGQLKVAQAERDREARSIAQEIELVKNLSAQKAKAEKTADDLKGSFDANRAQREALTKEIELLHERNRLAREGRSSILAVHQQTSATEELIKFHTGGGAGKVEANAVESAATTARQVILDSNAGHAPSTSPAQNELLQAVGKMVAGHDLTLTQAAQMFTSAAGNSEQTLRMLERLISVVEKQPGNMDEIARRVRYLESRMNSNHPSPP